jgi:hypothetical protein
VLSRVLAHGDARWVGVQVHKQVCVVAGRKLEWDASSTAQRRAVELEQMSARAHWEPALGGRAQGTPVEAQLRPGQRVDAESSSVGARRSGWRGLWAIIACSGRSLGGRMRWRGLQG